jgi:hypothetical protein
MESEGAFFFLAPAPLIYSREQVSRDSRARAVLPRPFGKASLEAAREASSLSRIPAKGTLS